MALIVSQAGDGGSAMPLRSVPFRRPLSCTTRGQLGNRTGEHAERRAVENAVLPASRDLR